MWTENEPVKDVYEGRDYLVVLGDSGPSETVPYVTLDGFCFSEGEQRLYNAYWNLDSAGCRALAAQLLRAAEQMESYGS